MPDFVTHHIFGRRILNEPALPKRIKDICRRSPQAFAWGLQGPDPLYFHRVLLGGSELNSVAREMHHLYTGQLLEEWANLILKAPLACKETLLAYYYGFICHYACDSILHPYVYFWQKELCSINADLNSSGAHAYVESCIDTRLYARMTGNSVTEFQFKKLYDLSVSEKNAIAWCYWNLLHRLYNKDIPIAKVESCFSDTLLMQNIFYGNHAAVAKAVTYGEKAIGKRGAGSGHFKLKNVLPDWDCLNTTHNSWRHPFDHQIRYESVPQMMKNASNIALDLLEIYDGMITSGHPYFGELPCNFCGEPF